LSDALDDLLTPQFADLAERVERDLSDHVAERNERERNLLTVRGLGITSVSALLAATVISAQELLAVVALLVVIALLFADLDANRSIQAIERRLPYLRELGNHIRQLLSGRRRGPKAITDLQTQLRTYAETPPGVDALRWTVALRSRLARKPLRLRPLVVRHTTRTITRREALGGFGRALYPALAAGCLLIGGTAVGDDTRIQAVAGCSVPAGTDLQDAIEKGRCAPTPTPSPTTRPSCRVPATVARSRLVVQCTAIRGAVSITVQYGGRVVASGVALVSADGRARLDIGRLRPTRTYRVTITRVGEVVAASRPLRSS
jgi:hypothetical protein